MSEPGTRVEDAVTRLNRFVVPRRPQDRFVTLWVGVIDSTHRLLQYVDAGHGYAFLCAPDEYPPRILDAGDNLPTGVDDAFAYTAATVALPATGQLIVVSDGFIEQPAALAPNGSNTNQGGGGDDGGRVGGESQIARFGASGLRALAPSLRSASNPLQALFAALTKYAGSQTLCDDATTVLGRW